MRQPTGIGYRMSNARSMMQSDVVIVCMIVIGIIGVLMDKGIGIVFGLFTLWKKAEQKNKNLRREEHEKKNSY